MIQIFRLLLHQFGASLKSHAVLQLENLVLRHQIEILKRSAPKRARLTRADRVLFTWLLRLWPQVALAIRIVHPKTLARWHRHGRVAFFPFCRIVLKAAKSTLYPKELRTVGDHLKKRRLDLGLLQKDVAARLKVNDWTICNWENNKTVPAVRYLPRIIEFLGYQPFPAPQTLAEKLLACQRCLGLSRKRMANRLGVDEATLARWENGESFPSGKRLEIVEHLLNHP